MQNEKGMNTYCRLVVIILPGLILIAINLPKSYPQIMIEHKGKIMQWDGCLYRKTKVAKENQTSCYQCTIDENRSPIPLSVTDWPQVFINCTDYCDHATICTKVKYWSLRDTPPVLRPLCYQCENKKTEIIWFESIYHIELCPSDCQRCAEMVDLSDAVKCAPICKGLPTFCYPLEYYIGEKICYQAKFWYGCDYIPIHLKEKNETKEGGSEEKKGGELTEECQKCAKEAGSEDNAYHCGYACSNFPTYHDGTDFLQCRSHAVLNDKHNDWFIYNIPKEVFTYLHLSNFSTRFPNEVLDKVKYLDGYIARHIYEKFDIARFNRPYTHKYRMRLAFHEALDLVPTP